MSIAFSTFRTRTSPTARSPVRPRTADESVGLNGKVALVLTTVVGTMWCAYAFAGLALVALHPLSRGQAPSISIQWISQTFIQLVDALGHHGRPEHSSAEPPTSAPNDLQGRRRDVPTNRSRSRAHLLEQDAAINTLLDKIAKLEAALVAPQVAPRPRRRPMCPRAGRCECAPSSCGPSPAWPARGRFGGRGWPSPWRGHLMGSRLHRVV